MQNSDENLSAWISMLKEQLADNRIPGSETHPSFLKNEAFIFELIDKITSFSEDISAEVENEYAAYLLAFDICVAELKAGIEEQNKHAKKQLNQLMLYLAQVMHDKNHSLSFYLPLLNTFYEGQVELSEELKQAYFDVADKEENQEIEEDDYLDTMKDMLHELSDLSVFEVAEHIFSQSYAMQPDFYFGLISDLCSIEEGHEVALMFLLHPHNEVRSIAILVIDQMIFSLTLSSMGLSRLKMISQWYTVEYQTYFTKWLKIQRKKGCVYAKPSFSLPKAKWYATEIDGSGAQGLFIYIQQKKQYRLTGLLINSRVGIKEVWLTVPLSKKEITHYIKETFEKDTVVREVTREYFNLMINHFLGVMHGKKTVPSLHLLEIHELLNLDFTPECIDTNSLIQELGVQITPFTAEVVADGVKRSKKWIRDKRIAKSWFEESSEIDSLVNQCCNIEKGVKVCAIKEANTLVIDALFNANREKWVFHFLWTALWLKAKTHAKERFWKDCFFVAYALHEGCEPAYIPIANEIATISVFNSLETMGDRKSYLNLSK